MNAMFRRLGLVGFLGLVFLGAQWLGCSDGSSHGSESTAHHHDEQPGHEHLSEVGHHDEGQPIEFEPAYPAEVSQEDLSAGDIEQQHAIRAHAEDGDAHGDEEEEHGDDHAH